MCARRGATSLCGILPIDKPSGMTSHDVVAAVRRATGEGRVGHAGTLDPMATGLLVVLLGSYTRLEPYLSGATKRYEARITFGTATDTDDAEGACVATARVPEAVGDPRWAQGVLAGFTGAATQVPPSYSAIKVGGRTAHRVARSGGSLEIAARPIVVEEARLVRVDAEDASWVVDFTVSKGTYVRALARDVGVAAGTVAHLTALRRLASGALTLDADAHSLEDACGAAQEGRLADLFADPFHAVGLPVIDAEESAVADGSALGGELAPDAPDGSLIAVRAAGRLGAVYRASAGVLRAEAVFPCEATP